MTLVVNLIYNFYIIFCDKISLIDIILKNLSFIVFQLIGLLKELY